MVAEEAMKSERKIILIQDDYKSKNDNAATKLKQILGLTAELEVEGARCKGGPNLIQINVIDI